MLKKPYDMNVEKKHEWKMYSTLLSDDVDGDLLKYFDKFFSNGAYNVI